MRDWLYKAAKEMYEADESIQKNYSRNDDEAYDTTSKMFIDGKYNRLKNIYNGIKTLDENFTFNIEDAFSEREKQEFVKYIAELSDNREFPALKKMDAVELLSYKNDSKSNRYLLSNIKRGDYENQMDRLIAIMLKRGNELEYKGTLVKNYKENRLGYIQNVISAKAEILPIIRSTNDCKKDIEFVCKWFEQRYGFALSNTLTYAKSWPVTYDMQQALYMILEEIDVFEYLFLQCVIYMIIHNEGCPIDRRVEILKIMKEDIVSFNKSFSPRTNKAGSQNIFNAFATYLVYIEKRNEIRAYTDIMDTLVKQMQEPTYSSYVDKNYDYGKVYVNDMSAEKIMYYVLEGQSERKERFEGNIEDIGYLIELLRNITGRMLDQNYLQHLKVVYREILLDKMKYNNKTARTVMRNIESKNIPYFEYMIDSMFIREKISRGFFREKGTGALYILKCDIQNKLYEAELSIFTNYDETRIAKDYARLCKGYKKILTDAIRRID